MTEPIQTTTGRTGGQTGAAYDLLSSVSTVQVLSPTVVNDVVYCTIQTHGHGVIASLPIQQDAFESVNSAEQLQTFSLGIEEVMNLDHVIAGTGTQTLDAAGLLQDNLTFTVQYVPPGSTGTSVTADVTVPNSAVMGTFVGPSQPGISEAQAAIDATYAQLQTLAGG